MLRESCANDYFILKANVGIVRCSSDRAVWMSLGWSCFSTVYEGALFRVLLLSCTDRKRTLSSSFFPVRVLLLLFFGGGGGRGV